MDKYSDKNRAPEQEPQGKQGPAANPEEELRRLLAEQGGDHDTFNPRTGEDPGLLPLTEDPLERRLKRNTM